jgi:hypothetical protein
LLKTKQPKKSHSFIFIENSLFYEGKLTLDGISSAVWRLAFRFFKSISIYLDENYQENLRLSENRGELSVALAFRAEQALS